MIYEIHLYAPKTGKLTPAMLDWLFQNGQRTDVPEKHWPVRMIRPKAMARLLLRFDKTLRPVQGPGGDVELHYRDANLDLIMYAHDRGLILFFPYTAYNPLTRVVLGICYVYIRYLYDAANFWSYDPQLDVISYADDFQSIDDTVRLMDKLAPKLLSE